MRGVLKVGQWRSRLDHDDLGVDRGFVCKERARTCTCMGEGHAGGSQHASWSVAEQALVRGTWASRAGNRPAGRWACTLLVGLPLM